MANTAPVTSLETLVTSKYQTLPLSTLKDATLGIEAEYYLWKLLHTQPSKEPLLSALGGFPYGLRQAIEDDLAIFKSAGIKPLFVFNGLKIARTETPFSSPDLGPASRLTAWDMYDRGLPTRAVEAFGESGMQSCSKPITEDFLILKVDRCPTTRGALQIRSTHSP